MGSDDPVPARAKAISVDIDDAIAGQQSAKPLPEERGVDISDVEASTTT